MSHLAWYFFANAYASLGKFGHLRVRSLVWEARAFVLVPRLARAPLEFGSVYFQQFGGISRHHVDQLQI